jgi:LacI family transcriptional regulator
MAGVSAGTIDRVIHNRGEVADITRERVMKIIRESHYVPDILARTLASRKIFRFAILIPEENSDSSFWSKPLIGVNNALAEISHFGIKGKMFLFDQFSRLSFERQAEKMMQYEPDAVVIAPIYYQETLRIAERCKNRNIPYIFINSNLKDIDKLGFVGQDSRQSGYLAAKLMSYSLRPDSKLMVINISSALESHKHIMSRQAGFESFFRENSGIDADFFVHHIKDMDRSSIDNSLKKIFSGPAHISGVFVTNSKVYKVARFIKEHSIENITLIGYDLIDENIEYVENNTIDFLISQRPVEQGYRGIMTLFNYVVLNKSVKKEQHLPIDIITKENYRFYIKY